MLDGWKTIITSAVAAITGAMAIFGVVDQATATELMGVLVPLALIFLRMGVAKAEPSE